MLCYAQGEENELEEVEKELADINRGGLGSRSGTISPKGKGSESGQVRLGTHCGQDT